MSSQQKWLTGLKSTSLFRAPPQDLYERQTKTVAYVELFGQFASESFPEDIAELVRDHYPHKEPCLLDDVLATFVLHHPEHGHTILHPLLSCVIDGTLTYSRSTPPFGSFVSVLAVSSERDLTEQWLLACGEILRLLTHYNRPIYRSGETSADGERRSGSDSGDRDERGSPDNGRRPPKRVLTPWITDSLLAAPLGTKSDYFRWCGGVLGKYAGGEDLRPPTTAVSGKGHGKHPQLLSSTPRWAVANGAAVISSVCDDEVARYETADLTAAAVPALLLPPPATSLDEHLVAGLPPLEPFAQLFHRYYAIATPGATQRLLLGLLEAPPSWAPDALDAAVQLVELLRAAEDYSSSSFRLPENWFRLHFLRPMGAAMAMKQGIASDAAAALLFRLFSQPALLFPSRGHAQGAQVVQPLYGPPIRLDGSEEMEALAAQANEEATAKGVASLMRDHGPDVEWRICVLWEAAYGLIPLDKSVVDLPELVIATPLQPPVLSWTLFRPFLRVLEHLPKGCPSQACLRRIFSATVDAILQRTFPLDDWREQQKSGSFRSAPGTGVDPVGMAELRALIHCLFNEAFLAPPLAAQLLADALTVCLSHDTLREGSGGEIGKKKRSTHAMKDRGAVSCFDSYLVAAVCALACEVQLCSFSAVDGLTSSAYQARRLMSVLEGLLVVEPFSPGVRPSTNSPNDLVEAAIVAAHISRLLGKSRACTHALSAIVRCKWDPGVGSKAASILALVDGNDKAVEAVFDYTDKLPPAAPPGDEKRTLSTKQAQKIIHGLNRGGRGKEAALPLNTSDVTNLLCGCNGVSATVSDLLKAVLKQKQDLAVAIVPLLWQRLMSAEELPASGEGTSAKQGWLQVVDALCNVVLTYPEKATSVVLLQAERCLQPWMAGEGGQETWRMNTRIVFLLSELLRLPNDPQLLGLIANAGALLYQATDGMSVDGEPCTLPQLELLEAIVMAIRSLCALKSSSPRGLVMLLKERLPAMVRCLSHDSPRIRASSASLLREIVSSDVLRRSYPGDKGGGGGGGGDGAWLEDVGRSIAWETHHRRAEGLSESFLASAAAGLGCHLPLN